MNWIFKYIFLHLIHSILCCYISCILHPLSKPQKLKKKRWIAHLTRLLQLYIVMLLSRHNIYVHGDEGTRTYKITDKVFTCSSWLSMLINKLCDNVYKIVKRDTSLMIGESLKPFYRHVQRNVYTWIFLLTSTIVTYVFIQLYINGLRLSVMILE